MLGMNLHSLSSAVMRSVFYFLLVSSLLFITHGARYQFVGHHDEQQVHTIAVKNLDYNDYIMVPKYCGSECGDEIDVFLSVI